MIIDIIVLTMASIALYDAINNIFKKGEKDGYNA